MKIRRSLEKVSSALLIASMILGLFASPAISTSAVVRAQDQEPTLVPTEVVEPTAVPEVPTTEPTAIPEDPTAIPEEPTLAPEEPTLVPAEPTLEATLEPTAEVTTEPTTEPTLTPTLLESVSPTPTISATPTATELPEVVPLLQAQGDNGIPDHYIVVYKADNIVRAASTEGDSTSVMEADIASVESLGGTISHTYSDALTGFAAELSPEALKKLRQNPTIDYIEQDHTVSINDDIEINSIQDSATWGLDRIDQTSGLDGKYTYFYNGTGVHVYVIDTGILPTHTEFGGRATKDFDAFDDNNRVDDCNGHGTHVAGTIGGATYGVAKKVIIHAVRVLNCSGSGEGAQILAGIDYVTAHHQSPAVANMSLIGPGSTAENQAVTSAIASGVVFVVAAGNYTDNACLYSPASAPAAITVGATDLTDSPASYSNYGSCLDIFAPGTNITSSWYTGGYNTISGTSMASPHVAGAVALLLQASPSASPATITSQLLGNAVVGALNNVGSGSPNKMLFTKPLPNPTAPVLLTPGVGSIMNTSDPVLTWNPVTGATLYRVQISGTTDFASLEKNITTSDTSYEATATGFGLHYWRVMSSNPQGIESPWSEAHSFIIDQTPPGPPILTQPDNGSTVEVTPTLAWDIVDDATGYMVEVDDSNTFTAPVVYSNPATTDGTPVTSTSIKPPALLAGGTYYWHVRSHDAAGNWGPWSIAWSFVTSSPIPSAPILSSPASGAMLISPTPLVSWSAVDYGLYYQVEISTDPTFVAPYFEFVTKDPGTLSHTIAAGMVDGTKYYWHVRAVNVNSQNGPWSEMRYFTLDTAAPAAPVLALPAAFSTVIGIPTFTWSAPATATAYQFQYSTDSFATPPTFSTSDVTPITTTSYKPASLSTGIVYTWRVRARDAYGNWGNFSDTRWVNVQASLPAIPVVTTPVAGLVTNNITPTFTWNAVADAVTYEIQVDNLTTFASPEVNDSSATNSYTPSTPLKPDGVFYYRIRSVNATGGAGAWSATRSFTLDTGAPVAPVLTTPLDAATPIGMPAFTWAAVTGANAYQFQYAIDTSYSLPYDTGTVTPLAVTSHNPTVYMTVGTKYYWHVRARDIAGNWGPWSVDRTITVLAAIPVAPVVTGPAIGLVTNDTTPDITWNAIAGAASYDVQIDNLATFASPEVTGNVATNTFTPSSPITPDALYYYHVRAINTTGGVGPWSAARSFTLDTLAPAAPVLTTPLDAATPIGMPTFTWAASTGANAYQFQYAIDTAYSSPYDTGTVTPLAVTSHKPTVNMTVGTTYYWHVRARDIAGNWGPWSVNQTINVQAALPVAPVVTGPAIGLVTNDTTPDITWTAIAGVASYDIQIDNLSTFASPEVTGNVATNTFTPSSPITPDALYYYRVRAINTTGGAGAWSAARSFTLDTTAPVAPVLTTPLDAATPIGTPTFTWAASAGANAYQFQYAIDTAYSSPYDTGTVTPLAVTSHKPTANMTVGTTYYWHVRARDIAGNWGPWSVDRTINVQAALPVAPVVTGPAIGLVTNDTTPDITWTAIAGAASYDIQIDNLSTFASPEVTGNVATNTFTPSSPITPDALYYYRVRAINTTGGAGPWSAARSFTLDTTAPAAPVLTTPLDAATPIGMPTFTWAASSGANAYQFQYAIDTAYSSPYDTGTVTPLAVTSHKPTVNMTVGTTYYWHVRARDIAGNWGPWSVDRTINVQAAIPVAPVVTAPAIGLVTNDTTPDITWTAIAGVASYDIQIDNLSTFASPEVTGNVATNTFTPSSPITPDALYYYRVRAINTTGGAGPWSAARSFTLDTLAPAAPVLTTPLDAATPIGMPTFTWAAVTGANAYQFQYAIDTAYSLPYDTGTVTPLAVTSHNPTVYMTVGTKYYWHVRARDIAGNWGPWSVDRTITVLAAIPVAPVITAPAIGLITNNATPTITWNSVTGAASYDVQIDNLATFASPEVTGNVATNTFTPSSPITPDALYYYHVRAINTTGGVGPWSAARSFTLDTVAPAAPVLTSPLGSATPIGTPTFTWSASAGANAYQFQYTSDGSLATIDYSTPDGSGSGTPLTVTSHKPTVNMTVGTGYLWMVRARDMAGNWGAWSDVRDIYVQAALPLAPVVTAPAIGLVTNNTTPTFTWNVLSDATRYYIEIDNQSTFASPELTDRTITNSYTLSAPLTPDGLYYYHVRAANATSGKGPWSTTRTFTLDTTAPVAPVLTTPLDAVTPIGTPTFTWAASTGANAYQFQYAIDTAYSSPYDTGTVTPLAVTSHKPTVNMTVGTTYYWHVRARDLAGNWGPWSVDRTINVQAALPVAPVVTGPAIGLVTNDTTPDITWTAIAGVASYDIQIDNLSTFASPEVTGNVATNTFTPSSPITPDALYYYRVRAINTTGGVGPWSAARSFTLDTVAPVAPVLTTPLDAATPIGTPTFTWAASAGANAYQFQYAIDTAYSSPYDTGTVTPLAVTSHKPTANMTVGTTYYWHVRARDIAGNWGPWSVDRTINVQAAIPVAPVITAPAIGLITNNATPTITWNSVTGAASYDVQIDNLASFASPEAAGNVATTSFTPSSPITPDTLYYYRVRAINATGGVGAWSAARSFTLDTAAPAAPVLSLPANAGSSVGNPTFTWAAVTGAKYYELQLALASDFGSPISLVPVMPITVYTYKPTTILNSMSTYYWRVRAQDVAGNWGGWSTTRSVTVVPAIPPTPVLSSPALAAITNDSKTVFTWASALNASSYRVQVSSVATFATTIVNASVFTTTYQPGISLGSDGTYYWRVQSVNAIEQASAWSVVRSFTLDTVAPVAPNLTAPVEGTILAPGIPTFTWAAVVGATAYQFQMDDFFGHIYNTPGGPAAEFTSGNPITITSHIPLNMTPAVLYYWRVRASDAAGNWSAWSNYRRVIEQVALPVAPVLSSPVNLIHISDQYPILTWNNAANAVKYEIQVDNYANFIGLTKIDQTLASGVLTWAPTTAQSGDLYWRVRGLNVNGMPGPWSAVRKLTIDFATSFNSDSAGWAYSTSQWTLSGGSLVAPGLSDSGYISSATYDAIYSDFTYEAQMRMALSSSATAKKIDNVYGVFVHAGTSSSTVDFSSGYLFLIGQVRDPVYGDWCVYTVYKITNASWTSMTNSTWYWLQVVNPGEWATIKTISNGSTLAFYVNGSKIISIANAGPKFGKVGVLSWWNYDKQSTYVNYANMSAAQAITSTSFSSATSTLTNERSIADPGFYAPFGN